VVLTARDVLPTTTVAELDRLDPASIIVLGGPGVISDSVALLLGSYVNGGSVVRVAGNDRYDTAARVAANFPAPVDVVYVASGHGFADALAAGPAAGSYGGPLLLVEPNGIPASTAAELDRLDPEFIAIAGDTQVVSAGVEAQLAAYAPNVVREAGGDRYATSVAVSAGTFETAPEVFLATGANFPDAIAASAFAAPVLLVQQTCIPAIVAAEIQRLGPELIVVLGGESTLSAAVAQLQVCGGIDLPRTG
jgi:putative cell wall-binding protein